MIRIEVSQKTAPITWGQFKAMKHIKKKNAKALENKSVLNGANPNEWRISFRKVPHDNFLSVQHLSSVESNWEDISEVLNQEAIEVISNNTNISGTEFLHTVIKDLT